MSQGTSGWGIKCHTLPPHLNLTLGAWRPGGEGRNTGAERLGVGVLANNQCQQQACAEPRPAQPARELPRLPGPRGALPAQEAREQN